MTLIKKKLVWKWKYMIIYYTKELNIKFSYNLELAYLSYECKNKEIPLKKYYFLTDSYQLHTDIHT